MTEIDLSYYLEETLHEAKRLLEMKSLLGRLPLSKKQQGFRDRINGLIDDWFENEPNRSSEVLHVEPLEIPSNLTEADKGSQYNALSLDEGSVLPLMADGCVDVDDIPF